MMNKSLPAAALVLFTWAAQAQSIDRVEPPFWWTGMKHKTLQLVLHGTQLGGLDAKLRRPGVTLKRSTPLPNPHYLVLDLELSPGAKPGPLTIELQRGGRTVLRQTYDLRAREAGSARRQGFGPADAIYLVVPDRFANGDPSNDNAEGYGDPVDRANKGGRHGGDLKGIADHLDYIAGLGFTQLWPTPIIENRQPEYSYHGYSATDLYRIDPRFGSNEDYRRLVQQARAKGLGVIMDLAPNHIGSGHWWMKDPPAPDWLNNAPPHEYVETNHRHVTAQDRYAAEVDQARFTDGWFVPTMPDLNQRHPVLATYLVQNALWWIEAFGLSGIRADTYPYSDKAFLARWSGAIMAEYPNFSIVGEEMTEHASMVAYWLEGHRNHDGYVSHMPSMMDFPLHGVLRLALLEPDDQGYGVGLGRLYEALVEDQQYPRPDRLVLFNGNHDTNRAFSALGEDEALMKLATVYLATIARTPQWFYGDELLMKSPIERDDGRVRGDFPGGWADDPTSGFKGAGLTDAQRGMQSFVRTLFNWRKTSLAVQRGQLIHYAPERGTYTWLRLDAASGQRVMVVLNKATTPVSLDTRRFRQALPDGSRGTDILTGAAHELSGTLVVPPRSAMVIEVGP